MTEKPEDPLWDAMKKIAAILELPEPEPFTREEQRRFQEWLDEGGVQARACYAEQRERPAA